MDFGKLPIGFAMALAQNEQAMTRYSAMTEAQRSAVLAQAHAARSEEEMHHLVAQIGSSGTLE